MKNSYLLQTIYLALIILVTSCAIERAPTGGPRDETPPQIIGVYPPDQTRNFDKKEIRILFDEFVVVRGVSQQVLVSPPMEKPLKFRTRGKWVIVEIQSELKPDVTYTINFGEAIVDFHENNPVKNFTYVFSTGEKIDAGSIRGRVKPMGDLKSLNDLKIQLYENLEDSAVIKERPLYFTRTEQGGSFQINNIKAGEYKIYALKDENANYQFDQVSEWIGYIDTSIKIDDSIAGNPITIEIFQEAPKELFVKETLTPKNHQAQFVFSKPYKAEIRYEVEPKSDDHLWLEASTKDTLYFYSGIDEKDHTFYFTYSDGRIDTVKQNLNSTKPERLQASVVNKKTEGVNPIYLKQDIVLEYDMLAEATDLEKFEIIQSRDSAIVAIETVDIIDHKKLRIKADWQGGMQYQLRLYKGAVQFRHGISSDTATYTFRKDQKEDYGTVIVNLDSTTIADDKLLEVIADNGNVIWKGYTGEIEGNVLTIKEVRQGGYAFRITIDQNKNGKWDTGNYQEKRQPEYIENFSKKIQLKGNWEAEVELKMSK